VEVWTPPRIDLKQDLDDVAALCRALDLVIGPANATTNLAAGGGTPTWLISPPHLWSLLGTDRFPWYPSVRLFRQPAQGQWGPVMAEVAAALAAL
jgi:ADP-heptose:LPS heptosyltransferase